MISRDCSPRLIEVPLQEIPEGELELFEGTADHGLEIPIEQARLAGVVPPVRVEHLQHRQAHRLLVLEVAVDVPGGRDQLHAQLTMLVVGDVVLGPLLRVAQHAVGIVQLPEAGGIAGLALSG